MIKILAIYGSPRRNGNTDRLLEAFLTGPAAGSVTCRRLKISEIEFAPCTGCQMCEEKGHCVVEDGMQAVYPWIDDADLVVLASPVYFYGLTAQAKALVDRSQALWARKHRFGKTGAGAVTGTKARAGFLISTGGSKGRRLFECVELTMKYFCDAIDARYLGSLTIRSLDRMGDVERHSEYLEQARQAGRRIVGELSASAENNQAS